MTLAVTQTQTDDTDDTDEAPPAVPPVPAPCPHGDDAGAVAAALGVGASSLLDLAASMNPFAPSVAELAAPHLGDLSRYPAEREVGVATETLARAMGVEPGRVLLTNGEPRPSPWWRPRSPAVGSTNRISRSTGAI
ncbi:MAG TPA: hypothetical protein VGF11_08795 [Acidimicrobiales bacterium]